MVDFVESDDTLSFEFTLEDVNVNKTFTPKSLKDVKTNDCYKTSRKMTNLRKQQSTPMGLFLVWQIVENNNTISNILLFPTE